MKAVRVAGDRDDPPEQPLRMLIDALERDHHVAIVEALDDTIEAVERDGHVPRLLIGDTTVVRAGFDPIDTDTVLDELAADGVDVALFIGGGINDLPTIYIGEHPPEDPTIISTIDRDVDSVEGITGRIAEVDEHETLASLVAQIERHPDSPKAGAIATFTGRVRAHNVDHAKTTHLEYEKYEDVADTEMAAIREELIQREGVYEVLLHHRTGIVEAESDAVYVVVLAGHRAEAFAAVSDGIDMLKARVPIFKKEVTETGEFWAHDRP